MREFVRLDGVWRQMLLCNRIGVRPRQPPLAYKANMAKDRSGSRTHFTHAYLWKAATRCLRRAEEEREGSFYEAMLAIVGAAFACEAYLNYAGPLLVTDWVPKEDEWKSPKEKLKRVLGGASLSIPHTSDPYQAYVRAFNLRNQIAHGRTATIEGEWDHAVDGISGASSLDADWMKDCTPERAKLILDGLEAVARQLHSKIESVLGPFDTLAEGESSGGGGT